MKKISIITIALLLIALATKAQTQKDEEEVNQAFARFGNSWAKADFSDMNEYVTEDCHWINVVGMHWHNRKEIQFAHQAFVSTMFKGVKMQTISHTVRFLTKEVALIYRVTHVQAYFPPDGVDRGNNKQGDNDNIATIVMIKKNGKWLIASGQNENIIAQAAANDPVLKMPK